MVPPKPERSWFAYAQVLLVLACALFAAPLFVDMDHWGRADWDQFLFRYETPRIALLRDHVLPLWNPYAAGGTVLLAHPNSPVLSPWYFLVMIFGAPLGLRLQVVMFFALGATGTATLLRRWGVSTIGCFVGGLVFAVNTHFSLHIAEGHMVWCALGLMPWLAIVIDRLDEGWHVAFIGALLIASILTLGTIYIPGIYIPIFSVWLVLRAIRSRRWILLPRWATVIVVGVMLSAVKFAPQLEFVSTKKRDFHPEAIAPASLYHMFLDPNQARLYKVMRDAYITAEDSQFRTLPEAEAVPLRNRLTKLGLNWAFQEYAAYIGYLGVALFVWGLVCGGRRRWPLYASGVLAFLIMLGATLPIDLWALMKRLPGYSSLHVPSRFLAAIMFVMAVGVGYGAGDLIARARARRRWLGVVLAAIIPAVIYVELTGIAWEAFDDIFVIEPYKIDKQKTFHHIERPPSYLGVANSVGHPYLMANVGILRGYEVIAVESGFVLPRTHEQYRGEEYLQYRRGTVRPTEWKMGRMTYAVEPTGPDNLIVNQNFHSGWRAVRYDTKGNAEDAHVRDSGDGLISVYVTERHRKVELYYEPRSFMVGVAISGVTLVGCGLFFFFWRRRRRRRR